MEWRKIDVCPESMTGTIQKKSFHFFRIVVKVTTVRAYTFSDVYNFYHDEKIKAIKSRLCSFSDFETKNRNLLEAINRVVWPVEDISFLGKLWVPISDEQLEFEALKPFLEMDCFKTFTFGQQLLVFKYVNQKTRVELLKQVSKQRQLKLLEAVTAPFEKKEEET